MILVVITASVAESLVATNGRTSDSGFDRVTQTIKSAGEADVLGTTRERSEGVQRHESPALRRLPHDAVEREKEISISGSISEAKRASDTG